MITLRLLGVFYIFICILYNLCLISIPLATTATKSVFTWQWRPNERLKLPASRLFAQLFVQAINIKVPGPRFNIKMTSYQYRKSHCGDKTILRPSYLHNGISYTGKTTSLYWIRAQIIGLCEWNPQMTGGLFSQWASNAENASIRWRHHETNRTTTMVH